MHLHLFVSYTLPYFLYIPQCSVTCGAGVETRQVACVNSGTIIEGPRGDGSQPDEDYCDVSVQPAAERTCNKQLCVPNSAGTSIGPKLNIGPITSNSVVSTAHWRFGGWSSVSDVM